MQVARVFRECANLVMDGKRVVIVGEFLFDERVDELHILLQGEFVWQRELKLQIAPRIAWRIPVCRLEECIWRVLRPLRQTMSFIDTSATFLERLLAVDVLDM